jgi:glycine cleavage system H protein
MSETKYTGDHEWVRVEGDSATIGITGYAQEQLGDVVFVELPEVGAELKKGTEAATVESVKAASEVYAAVSGAVTAVNEALGEEPSLVNSDPEGEGWFFRLKLSDTSELGELMDAAAYKDYCAGLE